MVQKLTHLDEEGRVQMVDIGRKAETERRAVARGSVLMQPTTLQLIIDGELPKGNVLGTAELAGIMAAKQTSQLIPLCHPLPITKINVRCTPNIAKSCIDVEAVVMVNGKTGVEMEALTAVTVAALTIYDMAKGADRSMVLSEIRVVEKSGGTHDFREIV